MPNFIFEKEEHTLRVTLSEVTSTLSAVEEANGVEFELTFATKAGDAARVKLTRAALQTLGWQCVAQLPALLPTFTVAGAEAPYRLPAVGIKALDDRSIQCLLRECQSECLIDFLWYMKDAELTKLMLRNMSQRAAEMLMDDLNSRWRGKNPDTALAIQAQRGREAVQAVLLILRRLVLEGQVEDIFGENHE